MAELWFLDALQEAMDMAGDRLDPALLAAARADLERAQRGYAVAGSRTIAALMGGTGSGKSALFNALTGSAFADVGEVRPSTQRAAAATWGERADELLDHLGVDRRLHLDPYLDRTDSAGLDGLVLLDMPDLDSVVARNSAQVDDLLPMIDVLIWVVDPQKYADHVLHERYLRALCSRSDAMVMVLNHVDALPPERLEAVVGDLRRLLDDDGLAGVPITRTCAVTGAGVSELRALLRGAVAQETTATRTLRAEAHAVAARLLGGMAAAEPRLGDAVGALTVEDLMRAGGVGAVAQSIQGAVATGRNGLHKPLAPSRAMVTAIGSSWATRARAGLPPRWAAAVDNSLPSAGELMRTTTAAVEAVPLPEVTVARAGRLRRLAVLAALAGIGLAVAGIVLSWPLLAIVPAAVGGLALVWVLYWRAGVVAREAAAERAAAYEAAVRQSLTQAVAALLVEPTRAVLREHRAVREALISIS